MQAISVFCLMQTLFDSLEVMAQSKIVSDLINIMSPTLSKACLLK